MPQRINIPGIGVVNFPDGMSDDEIGEAIDEMQAAGAEASLTRERQDPGTLPALMSGHAPGNTPPALKSVGGFLANAVRDLPAIPKTIWDTGHVVAQYNPLGVPGAMTAVNTVRDAWAGRQPSDPMGQAGAAIGRSPGAVFGAVKEKVSHPIRTAGEVADYAYDKPISTALDASALATGAGAGLRAAGRAPRLAAGLARVASALDPVAGTMRGAGALSDLTGTGAELGGEALMRKALNVSAADRRARPGVERTALQHRISATPDGEARVRELMEPIGERQQRAIDQMSDFAITEEQLPHLNDLVEQRTRTRGSDPARYNSAVHNRTAALTDPNFTSDRPVIDGLPATDGRYPQPVPARLLHENKQALQRRADEMSAYIENPELRPEAEALAARARDYRNILSNAGPPGAEYARANAEFGPLLDLQDQLRLRAIPRGSNEFPYSVGIGLQAAHGNVIAPAAGVIASMALKNPRFASAMARGSYNTGQAMMGAAQGAAGVAPYVNRLGALERAILKRRVLKNEGE